MELNKNEQLRLYTATQSSTIGWKEITCSKTSTANYQTQTVVRLTVSAGSPEIFFTMLEDQWNITNNSDGIRSINWSRGWRCQSNGTIDNPNGNGAADFVAIQQAYSDGGMEWGYWTLSSRQIDMYMNSGGRNPVIHIRRVLVYSERIDLITLSCM